MAKINNYQNKEENIKTIMPLFCPQCNKLMNSKLDKKMWNIHNKCFDCVIKEETKMRANGTFKKYQEKIIEKNILAQLKDEREKVTDIYNQLTFAIEYVRNDKGELEKWNMSMKQLKEIRNKYKKYIQQIDKYLDKIQSNNKTKGKNNKNATK